jgi:hypothetical protein
MQAVTESGKYVGLDMHKETIVVPVTEGCSGEVRYVDEITTMPEAVAKRVLQLEQTDRRHIAVCPAVGLLY